MTFSSFRHAIRTPRAATRQVKTVAAQERPAAAGRARGTRRCGRLAQRADLVENGKERVILRLLVTMKVRDAIRVLLEDGWVRISQRGSHRHFKHPRKSGKVTVPGKSSDDLPTGTYRSILRQAGLKE